MIEKRDRIGNRRDIMRKYHKRYRSFEERFISCSDFIEKIILKILIIFIFILITAQFLLSIDELRGFFVPLESIEGALSICKYKGF